MMCTSGKAAHLQGKDDTLAKAEPLLELAPDWRSLLTSAVDDETLRDLRRHENTGRPLGDVDFLNRLEKNLGRLLRRQKPGPKDSN